MLTTVKSFVRDQAIEMNQSDFYDSYTGNVPKTKFTKVCFVFFKKVVEEIIFKGNKFSTPIGSFYIIKQIYNSANQYVSHAGTKKVRKETGDDSIVVYRTEGSYFRFFWAKAKFHHDLKSYFFKAAWHNEREIETHKEILQLNVT